MEGLICMANSRISQIGKTSKILCRLIPVFLGQFGKPDSFQKSKWRILHGEGYHPSVEQIVKNIKERESKNQLLAKDWERLFNMNINLKDKIVLEIGFGTGIYVAEMIKIGAKKVIGIEIDKIIIDKSTSALQQLGITGFEFHEITDDFFDFIPPKSVNLVYEMTVFQHLLENLTLRYMQETSRILSKDGIMIAQFVMNDLNPKKHSSLRKQGNMSYSHSEVVGMCKKSNLRIDKYIDYDWSDGKGSYWRLYLFKPA